MIGLVVETHCNYFAPLAFPQAVEAGLRVGAHRRARACATRSACSPPAQPQTAAHGHFVHVYVDRATRRPVALARRAAPAVVKDCT